MSKAIVIYRLRSQADLPECIYGHGTYINVLTAIHSCSQIHRSRYGHNNLRILMLLAGFDYYSVCSLCFLALPGECK